MVFHGNGTMSYRTRKEYTFMPELSVGDHADAQITTLNVPAISAYYQLRNADPFTVWGLETYIYRYYFNKFVY